MSSQILLTTSSSSDAEDLLVGEASMADRDLPNGSEVVKLEARQAKLELEGGRE